MSEYSEKEKAWLDFIQQYPILRSQTNYKIFMAGYNARQPTDTDVLRVKELESLVKTYESAIDGHELRLHEFVEAINPFYIFATQNSRTPCQPTNTDVLRKALENLLDRYTSLVDSGDCGCWNWMEEDECIAAAEALTATETQEEVSSE